MASILGGPKSHSAVLHSPKVFSSQVHKEYTAFFHILFSVNAFICSIYDVFCTEERNLGHTNSAGAAYQFCF